MKQGERTDLTAIAVTSQPDAANRRKLEPSANLPLVGRRRMSQRIRARAIRRAGELLKQLDGRPNNASKQSAGDHTLISQTEAAKAAGMSKHQQVQAIRVASVPADVFVESRRRDS